MSSSFEFNWILWKKKQVHSYYCSEWGVVLVLCEKHCTFFFLHASHHYKIMGRRWRTHGYSLKIKLCLKLSYCQSQTYFIWQGELMELLCPHLPFKILLWSDSLAFNEIALQSRVSLCVWGGGGNTQGIIFISSQLFVSAFFFPVPLISYFHPSQTQAHLSALFTRNTGGYWGECSFTQVWSHHDISVYWSSHAGKAFLRANFYLLLCFLPF